MSYRELRNFCEIMRALGFPRLISMDNFRKPNFELIAEISYWLALRYDPNANISDNIDEEKNRVEFIKSICTLFVSKARIKLNPSKLYRSDGYAVQELLKISNMLYKAQISQGNDDEDNSEFSLPAKLSNLKNLKTLAQEITEVGAKVFDLLGKENELKVHRDKATQFLENISRNYESNNEQQYIEKCVREIIQQQSDQIKEMNKYVQNLEKDEKTLDEKIKKRSLDLERAEKRLKTINNVKPAYMEEYERLERDMEKLYSIYLDKFRNLEYLEHQLDLYNQEDLEKFEENQKALKKMQSKIKEEEMKMLRGDQEIDENQFDEQLQNEEWGSRAQSREAGNKPLSSQMNKRSDMNKMGKQAGFNQGGGYRNMQGPIESEDEELGEDDDDGLDDGGDDQQDDSEINQDDEGSDEDDNEF